MEEVVTETPSQPDMGATTPTEQEIAAAAKPLPTLCTPSGAPLRAEDFAEEPTDTEAAPIGTPIVDSVTKAHVFAAASSALAMVGIRKFRSWPRMDNYLLEAVPELIEKDEGRYQAAVEVLQKLSGIDLSRNSRSALAAKLAAIDALSSMIGTCQHLIETTKSDQDVVNSFSLGQQPTVE